MRAGEGDEIQREFERFFRARFQVIWNYVARRVPAQTVDDVVSRSFSVAWRRYKSIPQPPEDRLWLFGVARRCIADQHRSDGRRLRLTARASSEFRLLLTQDQLPDDPRIEAVGRVVETLAPLDREAITLVLWDGLSHEDAARVMKCSVSAFESRYRRARNAVKAAVLADKQVSPIRDNVKSKEVNCER